jgi:hypothetical protein
MGMLTDGPKYKRPTVDGYYVPTNLGNIGVGYYECQYSKIKKVLPNGVGMI